ncbi:TPA: hypothetical protein ACH3X2_010543 [Trebouxia sp. C0005]
MKAPLDSSCMRHSLSMSCVYCCHFAGHLLMRPNLNASFCALAERCKTRSLLSRTWAHLHELVMQVKAHSHCKGFAVNSTTELADKKSLKPEDAYEYINDVELHHDQVRHTSGGCACKSDLVLSVSAHRSGLPHVIVGSDRAGSSVCRHDN